LVYKFKGGTLYNLID